MSTEMLRRTLQQCGCSSWFAGQQKSYSMFGVPVQACYGLAESGVADERTWLALLGEGADPAMLGVMMSGNENDMDLTSTHESQGVWLVGEQRWERRQA